MSKADIISELNTYGWTKDGMKENPDIPEEDVFVLRKDVEGLQNKVSDEEKDRIIKLKDNYIKELDELLQSRDSEIRHLQNCLNKHKNKVSDVKVSGWKDKAELRLKIREKAKIMFDRYAIYKDNPIAWSVWKIAFNVALSPQFNEQKESEKVSDVSAGQVFDNLFDPRPSYSFFRS